MTDDETIHTALVGPFHQYFVGTHGVAVRLEVITRALTPEPDAPEPLSVLTLTPEEADHLAKLLTLYAGLARARRDEGE